MPVIDDARAYLGRSLEDVLQALGPDAEPVEGDEYGQLERLTLVHDATVFPGVLYLLNGEVELVYLGRNALTGLSPSGLTAQLGDDAIRLRSRAGKTASHWVHAEQGIAYSEQGDTLQFVEVFRPRTQQAYEAEIYREPPAFIR